MKRSIVIIGILLILGSWVGNLVFYGQHHLQEPLFMKHYYEYYGRGNYNMELHYLVNEGEATHVAYVQLLGLEEIRPRIMNTQRGTNYHSHELKSVFLQFQREDFEKLDPSKIYTIETMNVQFSNGTKRQVDIGKIIIHPTERHHSKDSPLDMRSSSSSSDNTGYQSFYVKEPIEIIALNHGLDEAVKDFLKVTVVTTKNALSEWDIESKIERGESIDEHKPKGKDINHIDLPIALEKGTTMYISHAFDAKEADARTKNYYFIEGRIEVEDRQGSNYFSTYYVDYRPYFTNEDIRHIIRERGDV